MNRAPHNQKGFIPMMLSILALVVFVIFAVYSRVMHAAH